MLADKIYTSNEFKKVKENFSVSEKSPHYSFYLKKEIWLVHWSIFSSNGISLVDWQSLAKNMETSEVKEWLQNTRVRLQIYMDYKNTS